MVDSALYYNRAHVDRALASWLGMDIPARPEDFVRNLKTALKTPSPDGYFESVVGDLYRMDMHGVYVDTILRHLKIVAAEKDGELGQAQAAGAAVEKSNMTGGTRQRLAIAALGHGLIFLAHSPQVDSVDRLCLYFNNLHRTASEVFSEFGASEIARFEDLTRSSVYGVRWNSYLEILLKTFGHQPEKLSAVDPAMLKYALEAVDLSGEFHEELKTAFGGSPVHLQIIEGRGLRNIHPDVRYQNAQRPMPPPRAFTPPPTAPAA